MPRIGCRAAIAASSAVTTQPKKGRELIWQIAASLRKPNTSVGERWTRPRIQVAIRRIVGETVGADDYRLKDTFVDDIGIS